jgi:hypothetical protein
MILIVHILIAFSSIVYTGFTYLFPTKNKLYISYSLVTLTLMTGSYLLLTKPSHILQTCTTGIIYLSFVTFGLVFSRKKLAEKKTE